jgi:hypothetical protein
MSFNSKLNYLSKKKFFFKNLSSLNYYGRFLKLNIKKKLIFKNRLFPRTDKDFSRIIFKSHVQICIYEKKLIF